MKTVNPPGFVGSNPTPSARKQLRDQSLPKLESNLKQLGLGCIWYKDFETYDWGPPEETVIVRVELVNLKPKA